MVYSKNKTGSRVLNFLKRREDRIWTADKKGIAII